MSDRLDSRPSELLRLIPPSERVSWSQISAAWRCPYSYGLSYRRDDVPRITSGAMAAGIAVHRVLDLAETEGWWWEEPLPVDRLTQAFAVYFGALLAGAREKPCERCGGSGIAARACPACGGSGTSRTIPLHRGADDPPESREVPCSTCDGAGHVAERCDGCRGKGIEDWTWKVPEAPGPNGTRLFGEDAIKWSGIQRIVEDPPGTKLQRRTSMSLGFVELEVPWWRAPDGLEYPSGEPLVRERTSIRNGKPRVERRKDQPVWVKSNENLRWWAFNGPLMCRRAGGIRRMDAEAGLAVMGEGSVEGRFTIYLPDLPPVTGVLDLVLMHDQGEQLIRDYKTGSSYEELQLAFYAWLLANLPEGHPFRREVTRGQIGYLRGTDRSDWIKDFDLSALVPLVPDLIRRHVAGPRAATSLDQLELRPSNFCGSCDVKESCPVGLARMAGKS